MRPLRSGLPLSRDHAGNAGDGRPIGTPYLVMRDHPCRMCRDIPCAAACPTGALDVKSVSDAGPEGGIQLNVNKARIGLAVIDRETCVAYWGIQCDACYRACPVIDKAITVEPVLNVRTGKHAILGRSCTANTAPGAVRASGPASRKRPRSSCCRGSLRWAKRANTTCGMGTAGREAGAGDSGRSEDGHPAEQEDPLDYLNQEGP